MLWPLFFPDKILEEFLHFQKEFYVVRHEDFHSVIKFRNYDSFEKSHFTKGREVSLYKCSVQF